jgi:hypothetical protein
MHGSQGSPYRREARRGNQVSAHNRTGWLALAELAMRQPAGRVAHNKAARGERISSSDLGLFLLAGLA